MSLLPQKKYSFTTGALSKHCELWISLYPFLGSGVGVVNMSPTLIIPNVTLLYTLFWEFPGAFIKSANKRKGSLLLCGYWATMDQGGSRGSKGPFVLHYWLKQRYAHTPPPTIPTTLYYSLCSWRSVLVTLKEANTLGSVFEMPMYNSEDGPLES